MIDLLLHERGIILQVKAHAAARRNGITGIRQGKLCVSVTQAPEKGKANEAIAVELAKALGVRRRDVELLSGITSSKKRFLVVGATEAAIRSRLTSLEYSD